MCSSHARSPLVNPSVRLLRHCWVMCTRSLPTSPRFYSEIVPAHKHNCRRFHCTRRRTSSSSSWGEMRYGSPGIRWIRILKTLPSHEFLQPTAFAEPYDRTHPMRKKAALLCNTKIREELESQYVSFASRSLVRCGGTSGYSPTNPLCLVLITLLPLTLKTCCS